MGSNLKTSRDRILPSPNRKEEEEELQHVSGPNKTTRQQEEEELKRQATYIEDSEQMHQEQWTTFQRYKILVIIGLGTFIATLTNPLFLPGLNEVQKSLKASDFQITLATSIYSLPLGFLPLFWGPLSDHIGRRKIYISVFFMMICITYFATSVWSITSLIVFRFIMGIPVSSMQVLAFGVLSDVFPRAKRGKASGILGAFPLSAPIVGSLIGGVMASYVTWRFSFLLQSILCTFFFLVALFFLPETKSFEIVTQKRFGFLAPYRALFSHKKIFMVANLLGLLLSQAMLVGYVISTATQESLELLSWQVGLLMLPVAFGSIVASIIGGRLSDITRRRKGSAGRLIVPVTTSLICCLLFPVFGFTARLNWWMPMIFSLLCGFFRTLASPGAITYALEHNQAPGSTTAGIGSVTFIWTFIVLLLAPLAADYIDDKYSYGYVFLTLTGLTFLLTLGIAYYMVKEFKEDS